MTMKLTVNGVDIEIEGAAEVEVEGKTVKIKTREPSQPCFVPSPLWVQPLPYTQPPRWEPPQITWTANTCGDGNPQPATTSYIKVT